MDQKKKILYIVLAVVLIVVGAFGGYMTGRWHPTAPAATEATTDQGQQKALTPKRNTPIVAAVKKVGPAVVGITTKIYNRDIFDRKVQVGEGVGSGVIFDKQGYIVTNYHVVAGADNNTVTVSLSDGTSLPGKVVGTDPLTDLAVVKIDTNKQLPVATFGNSDDLQVGEPAIAIGNPLGLEFQGTVTAGVISALHRTIDMETQRFPLIQTDAAINPGNSGGALVNADGEVIGINSEKIEKTGVEGMGFAIPINEVKPIVKELIANGKVTRPYLGLGVLDKNSAAKYGINMNHDGLLIAKIYSDGPAANTNIQRGDIITSVDGKNMTDLMALKQWLDSKKPGDTGTFTIWRNGQERQVQLTLGTMPTSEDN